MHFKMTTFETDFDQEESVENEIDLNALTVVELKEIAKEKEIAGYYSMNKQQLIEAINTAP